MRFGSVLRAACCAALILCASSAAADIGDYLGKPVVSVSIQSEGRTISDPHLVSLISTIAGRPLAMREIRESLTHLFSLGIYDDVQVRASQSGQGVALVFDLVPNHPVQQIVFTGTDVPGVDAGSLRQLLTDRFGQSPRAARSADMARALEDALHDDGYLNARVTARTTLHHQPEETLLTFAFDAGPRARLGQITVEGNPGVSEAALLSQLDIATGQPYERARLVSRVERFLDDWRRKGYYQGRLAFTPTFSDDGRTGGPAADGIARSDRARGVCRRSGTGGSP
ncbi:MAG: POTRA domain-containing protein [Vicinamibacterales bacterium]